jgi:hypothetical protein
MKTLPLLAILWLLTLPVLAGPTFPIPDSSRQVVVVLSDGWDDATALMWRFERQDAGAGWTPVGNAVKVNLGRTGLAWGRSSLIQQSDPCSTEGPRKKEGDGKSPAGLFPFLKAFGHPTPPQGYGKGNLPFLVITDQQCVDDTASEHYNQILSPSDDPDASWSSAEKMSIDLYRWGLVVGHNCPKAQPGLGSCIFYHLQRGPGQPTSGCTSMDASSLKGLLLWLQSDAQPVVLQLPRSVYEKMRDNSWPRL